MVRPVVGEAERELALAELDRWQDREQAIDPGVRRGEHEVPAEIDAGEGPIIPVGLAGAIGQAASSAAAYSSTGCQSTPTRG